MKTPCLLPALLLFAAALFPSGGNAAVVSLKVVATSAPDGSGMDVPFEAAGTKFTKLDIPSVDGGLICARVSIQPSGGAEVPAIFIGGPVLVMNNIRAPQLKQLLGILVRAGDSAPGTTGVYKTFGQPAYGGSRVAFTARVSTTGAPDTTGLWSTLNGSIGLVAASGSAAPDADGNATTALFDQIQSYVVTEDGSAVTFIATLKGPGVRANNKMAVFQQTSTATRQIFRTGDTFSIETGSSPATSFKLFVPAKTIPGQRRSYASTFERVEVFATFPHGRQALLEWIDYGFGRYSYFVLENTNVGRPGLPSFNDNGYFAMRAGLTVGASYTERSGKVTSKTDQTILSGYDRFTVGIVAQEGTAVSSTDPELFTAFEEPALNNNFNTAFFASVKSPALPASQRQVLVYNAENTGYENTVLARSGTAAAGLMGGELWQSFTAMVLPNTSYGPLFLAKLSGSGVTATNNIGLWGTDTDGTVFLFVRTGDTVSINGADKVVSLITTLGAVTDSPGQGRYVDQDGDVSALLTFTDSSTALVYFSVSTPTP